ncbi:unnamed protein product [Didymodactylos carnosus]|uniref:Uncharacterized protein n=1 Tax=Didymodactylos carnosus TaxID=1234261 RepID=A0A815XMC7_9BILA|nr:unnamed protein product [Didymodactylos carnosus]CAF1559263.1 unnamed protein product [Didymodactylos carnosus]CAF4255149.1 unnamed protein product [Didymodactylos carnosus]CAF4420611.1 unnamed protein product [Didymodactylos carnosus]
MIDLTMQVIKPLVEKAQDLNQNLCKTFVIRLNAIEQALRESYVIDKSPSLLYEESSVNADEGEEKDEKMNEDNGQLT